MLGPILRLRTIITRTPGVHRLSGHTCVSFPIGEVRLHTSCHHGPTRLSDVVAAVGTLGTSGGLRIVNVGVRNFTSPRNTCGRGRCLTGGHTVALARCIHGVMRLPSDVFTMSSATRS